MGYIDFTDGNALPASSLDEMSKQGVLVYATTVARDADAALTAALREGMKCYVQSTDREYTYNGGWIVTGHTSQGGRVGGQWSRNTAQSIPATTLTAISWDTETYDPDNILAHHATTGTLATLAMEGMYTISCKLSHTLSFDYMRIEVGALTWDFPVAGSSVMMTGSLTQPAAAGTTVRVYVYQPGGGAHDITSGSLFIHRVGP